MITLNDLVVGYDKPLMEPLNFTFENRKIYGILGKSGCGKSTLLKTIAKMHKPISGSVKRDDNQQIYMMHQRYTNFNWLSCIDNVLIAERKKRMPPRLPKAQTPSSIRQSKRCRTNTTVLQIL